MATWFTGISVLVLFTAVGYSVLPWAPVSAASLANGSPSDNTTSVSTINAGSVSTSKRNTASPQYSHNPVSVFIQLKLARQSLPAYFGEYSSSDFLEFVENVKSEASKAYRKDSNFLSVDVFIVSPNNRVIDLKVAFRISIPVNAKLRAVARLKQYIDNKGGQLGDVSVEGVAYISDAGELSATSDSRDVKCVSLGQYCFAFCDANSLYCHNGGTCEEDGSERILCRCIYEAFVHYAGVRCDRKVIGVISILIIALGLLVMITCTLYTIRRWKRTGSPVPRASTRGYSTRHLEGTENQENGKCAVWASEASRGTRNPVYDESQGPKENGLDHNNGESFRR